MNLGTFIVLAGLIIVLAFIVRSMRKGKSSCGCGGSCGSCGSGSSSCSHVKHNIYDDYKANNVG